MYQYPDREKKILNFHLQRVKKQEWQKSASQQQEEEKVQHIIWKLKSEARILLKQGQKLKVLRKGEKWETSFKPFGIEGSNSALLEVSSLPSINLEKRIEYLLDYPHGCSEQITSAAFPQLWLGDLASG